MINLGVIKDLCKKNDLSVRKLAEKLDIKPSSLQSAIDNNSTTLSNLEKIANYFDVPVGIFFGEKELPDKIEKLLSLFKGKFSSFDDTLCFVVKQFAEFKDKELMDLFKVAKKKNGVKSKYDFCELLYDRRMLGCTLNVPPLELSAIPESNKSKSEHGILIYSFLSLLQNVKVCKDDLLTLRGNGIISKDLGVILTYWVNSDYSVKDMLKSYEQYLSVQEVKDME